MPKIAIERDLGANFPMTPVGGGGVKGRLAISRRGSIYHGRGESLCIMNYGGGVLYSTSTIHEGHQSRARKQ